LGDFVKAMLVVSTNLAVAPHSSTKIRLSRLRLAKGYELAVGGLGCGWFLILALLVVRRIYTHAVGMNIVGVSPIRWSGLLSSVCALLFYLALSWLMLIRRSAVARSNSIMPSVVAFIGAYLPWTLVLFAPQVAATPRQDLTSAALLLVGSALMVVVIFHLGRSFSVVPQARGLVRGGQYSFVRHPLYLAEEIALLGILLQVYSLATLTLFLAHGALQVIRIFYEETLLRRTFPNYEDYTRSTARLIPYVW
jgi:protein-S-isoprenylcysteine O-methyltransferase Ste14